MTLPIDLENFSILHVVNKSSVLLNDQTEGFSAEGITKNPATYCNLEQHFLFLQAVSLFGPNVVTIKKTFKVNFLTR